MASFATNVAYDDARRDPREEVYFRTRADGDRGRNLALLVVNISARGLMARVDREVFVPGDALTIRLPAAGTITAEVRWALGGRIGVEFAEMIELSRYFSILAEVLKR